ncbi:MAG: response regulator transcription factor [Candidatus Omnitrophica bacterium]|nr:response regulator transcription factor [Candidatus Omnitrophota bacterium]
MENDQNMRILIVDDEKAIRRFLKATLVSHGYNVFEAANGAEALKQSVFLYPDAVILDLGLPDMDGVEVTRQIRKRSQIPVIILSVRENESDKIAALDAGADDYLTKPFKAGEMLARIRAVMRRLLPQNYDAVFTVGKLSVDIGKRNVTVKGKLVHLTPIEYAILKFFVLNAGKVLTHKQILNEIWDKTEEFEGTAHLLRVTISNLRNKIETDPNRPTYILTEPGVGYRLSMDV